MDQYEQSGNQQQIVGAATQIPNSTPALCAAPAVATSALSAPVSLPTLHPQSSNSQNQLAHNQARHFNDLEQKLQIFWATQKQQVEQTTNFKNHSFPLSRVKKIMKADKNVSLVASETPVLFAKACEMFIMDLSLRGWTHTEENSRRTLQTNDIAAAISENELFDFLVDVIPKDAVNPTNATILQVGSSAEPNSSTPNHYVPQHYSVSPSGTTLYAGGQQTRPYMACPLPKPQLQPLMMCPRPQPHLQPFMAWPQLQLQSSQQNQEQPFMPWAPQPHQQQDHQEQNDNDN